MTVFTNIKIAQGALGTSNATLATCPVGKKFIIKEILIANVTGNDVAVTVSVNGTVIVGAKPVFANDTLAMSLNTIVDATSAAQLIQGFAATASACNYYISGIEIGEQA